MYLFLSVRVLYLQRDAAGTELICRYRQADKSSRPKKEIYWLAKIGGLLVVRLILSLDA